MNGLESAAVLCVARVIAVAVALQTIELFMIRASMGDEGIWSWNTLKAEFSIFPSGLRRFFEAVLKYPNCIYLIFLQGMAALCLLLAPSLIAVGCLLATTTLFCLRWRGTFNGGSDFMTLVVLSASTVAIGFMGSPGIVKACLWYLAIQACTSYFNAGLVKLKAENWRSGRALTGFFSSAMYKSSSPLDRFIRLPKVTPLLSWLVILFECSFPMALIGPELCSVYLGFSFVFHLSNVYVFGLNRFLFAWMAAYPAIYYCAAVRW